MEAILKFTILAIIIIILMAVFHKLGFNEWFNGWLCCLIYKCLDELF